MPPAGLAIRYLSTLNALHRAIRVQVESVTAAVAAPQFIFILLVSVAVKACYGHKKPEIFGQIVCLFFWNWPAERQYLDMFREIFSCLLNILLYVFVALCLIGVDKILYQCCDDWCVVAVQDKDHDPLAALIRN